MSKPGKWLYVLAGVVAVGGSSASLYSGCSGAADSIRDMRRAVSPDASVVELPAGRHGVFYESVSSVNGASIRDSGPRQLRCDLTGPEGDAVELTTIGRVERYNLAGYSGELLWDIEVERGGAHLLTCSSDRGGQYVVAIGEGFTVGDVMIAIVGGAASVMVGLAIFFLAFIRRRSSRGSHADSTGSAPAP